MSNLVGFFLCALFSVVISVKSNTTITVLSVNKCPVGSGGKEIEYTMSFEGDEGNKYVKLAVKLTDEVNNKYTFKSHVLVHNGLTYVPYIEANGYLGQIIGDNGKSVIQRIKQGVVPALTDFDDICKVPPGNYKLDKLTISKDDFVSPIPTAGKYKADMHLFDPSGVERVCFVGEGLVKIDYGSSEEE